MQVTPAYLESVVTFYDMLRGQPIGPRYAYVCTGVACCMRLADFIALWIRRSRTTGSATSVASSATTWVTRLV